MTFSKLLAGVLVLSSFATVPAFADHDHDNWRHHDNGWHGHRNDWNNGHRNDWNNGHRNNWRNNNLSWDQERDMYRTRWNRLNAQQRRQLDRQMKAQWIAYHQNQAFLNSQAYRTNPNVNWNNTYGWNYYSDPGFIDYLHGSNPSILTTIRSYLGF